MMEYSVTLAEGGRAAITVVTACPHYPALIVSCDAPSFSVVFSASEYTFDRAASDPEDKIASISCEAHAGRFGHRIVFYGAGQSTVRIEVDPEATIIAAGVEPLEG